MTAGIDYGLDKANIDSKTGIHYGVISQHSVMLEAMDDFEPDYGDPHCPSCGDDIPESGEQNKDYICKTCDQSFSSDEIWDLVEPNGFTYDQDGYKLTDCLDTDIFVLSSPYFTYASFCSPCVPGAGDLDSPHADGVKCYALGHDWFDGDKAPYPVFSVEDNSEVLP